ncbi:MAG TPA: amino acid adenylation domain-containing protein [Vicinamibacterales bacterium]|nr:amino acid adenylation domain-containing protein [Vicinamibacterales bacterium]
MAVPIDRANLEDVYELSPLQQGLLFHAVRDAAGGTYLEQLSLLLVGRLDAAVFEETWRQLMARHAVLRTAFVWDDLEKPAQLVLRNVPVPLEILDWSGAPERAWRERLDAFLAADRARGYDLGRAPLMRLVLIRLADDRHAFVWSHHHLLLDGWSTAILLQEALALYEAAAQGRPAALPPPGRYREFVSWVRRQDQAAAEAFWRRTLAGIDGPTPLPFVAPSSRGTPGAFDEQRLRLSKEETTALQEWCRREHLTLSTVLQGAWAAVIGRLTGRRTIVCGATVSGRPPSLGGAETMVGLLINTLPVRAEIAPDRPAAGWLRDFQQHLAEVRQFEYVPLTRIQQWSAVPGGTPLFDSLVVFENYPTPQSAANGSGLLGVEEVRAYERTHYPLTLVSAPGDTLPLRLLHDTTRVPAAAAARLLSCLRELLRSLTRRPDQPVGDLNLLSDADRRQLDGWHGAGRSVQGERPVTALIAEHAAATPDATAVQQDDERVSYRELDARANRLARFLRRSGVGAGDRVGVCLDRSPALITSLLATLKAGAAYVPLDPSYPSERLAHMAADAAVRLILSSRATRSRIDDAGGAPVVVPEDEAARLDALPDTAPDVRIDLDGLAYLIYTSGSTGRPKGVAVTHRSLLHLVGWHREAFALGPADRCTLLASFGFDASVWETWPTLAAGATLDLVPPALLPDPPALRDHLLHRRLTVSFVPTPIAEQLLDLDWPRGGALRLLLTGGDRLTHFASDRLPFTLVNNYGPTEHTVVATSGIVGPRDREREARVPAIGRPIANTRAYILDERLNPLPPGADGELFLSGPGVAQGYWQAPDQTAERFLADPFAPVPGARMYRTGDRVRFLSDGRIEFLGRADDQIKLRGFRIEPAEIESALAAHPSIREAAVALREDRPGQPRLVGYLVWREGAAVPLAALEDVLAERLPDYMVPRVWVTLAAFPVTPNGKIDRRALPPPADETAGQRPAGIVFADAFEELLAGIWREVLQLDRLPAPEDDFFARGGHSLLALRLLTAIRQTWAIDLPLITLFERSSLRRMAAAIRDASRAAAAATPAPPLTRHRQGDAPLSFPQERLWFLEQLPKSAQAYHISLGFRIDGVLRRDLLERAVSEIVRRHDVLRTSFHLTDGRPVQRVEPAAPVTLALADLTGTPDPAQEAAIARLAQDEAARPFDLTRGPLLRGLLVRLTDRRHALLLTLHHIAADGWSMGVLAREFTALYAALAAGTPSPLPEPEFQYADFAAWQRGWLDGPTIERLLAFWRGQVEGAEPLELPADHPRPAVQSYRGRTLSFTLPAPTAAGLRALARGEGCTPYMVGFAAFATLLARSSGQDDFLVGSPVAGRDVAGTEPLVGCFVNTLAVRCQPDLAQPFRAYLAEVRARLLAGYAHQQLPFEQLVQAVAPERDLSRAPLFQVMFVWQHMPSARVELPGVVWTPFAVDGGAAKFDVTLTITDGPEGLAGNVEYSTDLFDAGTMERFVARWQHLLAAIVREPDVALGDLPLLPDEERRLVVSGWNQTTVAYPDARRRLHELVEAQVGRTPDAAALRFEEERLTYRELDRRANQLAHRLRRAGVGPDTVVGVSLERSLELVIALLATLKAGGAYLPLDPDYPRERLRFMLDESDAPVVLTSAALEERLPARAGVTICLDRDAPAIAREADGSPEAAVDSDHLAYVIYTSGSTGRPKGAALSHRAIVNRLLWMQDAYGLTPADRVLQKTPYSFDVSVWEFFWPLMTGAELVLARPKGHQDPAYLRQLIVDAGVTVLHFVPSMLELFLETPGIDACASLRKVFSSGEALSPELQARFFQRLKAELHNLYGPTEAAVDVTSWRCTPDAGGSSVPIGRPIANISACVLDSRRHATPIGVPGELHLAGVGLARGYLHRPDLTAERFVPSPFGGPGERLYRTGDRVRYRPDGAIEYLGRLDHQVKLRGFRIELGEIEAALARHPAVRQAVVLARDAGPGGRQLVAYLVAPRDLPLADLRAHLLSTLPDYMVPSAFVTLDALPLTASGKVDRRALPAPDASAVIGSAGRTPPRTPVEEMVAALWAGLLKRETPAVEDSFFELGGHSLLATQLLSRIRDLMQIDLPMLSIFDAPTLGDFSRAVVAAEPSPGRAEEVARAWLTVRRLSPEERARMVARNRPEAV